MQADGLPLCVQAHAGGASARRVGNTLLAAISRPGCNAPLAGEVTVTEDVRVPAWLRQVATHPWRGRSL